MVGAGLGIGPIGAVVIGPAGVAGVTGGGGGSVEQAPSAKSERRSCTGRKTVRLRRSGR